MIKKCPFSERTCDESCQLFVSPDDLNEFVLARLSSIGITDKKNGSCAFRMLALSQTRAIFEKTGTRSGTN